MGDSVHHDLQNMKFYIQIGNNEAHIDYTLKNSVLSVTHTYTPEELRGRGLAGKLMTAVIEFAEKNNLRIDPVCSYASHFMNKHKEHHSLMV